VDLPYFAPPNKFGFEKWWTTREDASLLVGTYLYGMGRYDQMRADPTLSFGSIIPLTVDMQPATDVEFTWPPAREINLRLKKLMRFLDSGSGRKKKEDKLVEDEETESSDGENDWTKREKLDFYRGLIAHGVPADNFSWDKVRHHGNLKKGNEATHKYYLDYLSRCRTVIVKQREKKQGKGKKRKRDEMEEEDEEEDEEDEETYGNGGEGTSHTQAVRALKRIILFSKLRSRVLPLPKEELIKIFSKAKLSIHIPRWWIAGEHDVGLVYGVNKYGFGEWEQICSDPEFPFVAVAQERIRAKEEAAALAKAAEAEEAASNQEKKGTTTSTEGSTTTTEKRKVKRERTRNKIKNLGLYTTTLGFPRDKVIQNRIDLLIKQMPFEDASKKNSTSPKKDESSEKNRKKA